MVRELQPDDPRVIGPYRLRGRLGRGGMGVVFLGTSAGGRLVAVKVVRADLATDPEFRARFQREVAVARTVSGQFTAPVIDADTDSPTPWLATAYVPGPSLADAVAEHGPLPVSSVLRLAAGLAEGLNAIHAAGVVHRDLKPANVLLAEDGPRVIDFGISLAAAASPLTRMGFVVGSPGFMSPEQASGRPVGPASDIFALGAILAFAATGQAPFGAGSAPTLAYRAVHDQPNLDRAPAEVRALIDRCMAKNPGDRPTAAGVLAEAGGTQPLPGWLPERLTRAFTALPGLTAADAPARPAPAVPTPTVVNPELAAFAQTRAGLARPGSPPTITVARMQPEWAAVEPPAQDRPGRRLRRGLLRPLAVASIVAGLVGASAVAGFALTGNGHPPVVHAPQMAAAAQRTSPATPPASPAPSATQTTYQPASPAPSMTPATTTAPSPTPTQTQTMSPAPATSAAPTPTPTPTPTQMQTMSPAPATSGTPTPMDPAPAQSAGPGQAG